MRKAKQSKANVKRNTTILALNLLKRKCHQSNCKINGIQLTSFNFHPKLYIELVMMEIMNKYAVIQSLIFDSVTYVRVHIHNATDPHAHKLSICRYSWRFFDTSIKQNRCALTHSINFNRTLPLHLWYGNLVTHFVSRM